MPQKKTVDDESDYKRGPKQGKKKMIPLSIRDKDGFQWVWNDALLDFDAEILQ